MKTVKIQFFVFFLILFVSPLVIADAATSVLIGRVNDWAPLYYQEAGIWQGISVDAYRALVEEAHVSLELKVLPWSRAMKSITSKPIMIGNLIRTKEREKLMYFFGPHHREVMGIALGMEYKTQKISSLDDLVHLVIKSGKKIVYQQDVFYSDEFNSRLKNNSDFKEHFQKRGSKLESSIKMINENRVLGYLDEKATLAYLIRDQKAGSHVFVHDFQLNDPADVYIGVSKTIPLSLYETLKAADARLKEKQIYQKLMEKWASPRSEGF